VTYDPGWGYTPGDRTPFWASLDTVEYVSALLEQTGLCVSLVPADDAFEAMLCDQAHRGLGKFHALSFMVDDFWHSPLLCFRS